MNQVKKFPENFAESDEFRMQILRLTEKCYLLQSARMVVAKRVSDSQPIIAFPEECGLLGIRLN